MIWQKTKELVKQGLESSKVRGLIIAALSLAVIMTSFCISIWITKDPNDASRGGAIVVAMSFYFILKNVRVIDPNLSKEGKSYIEAHIDKENRIFLSIMSIGGTLAWGFLDLAAARLLSEVAK